MKFQTYDAQYKVVIIENFPCTRNPILQINYQSEEKLISEKLQQHILPALFYHFLADSIDGAMPIATYWPVMTDKTPIYYGMWYTWCKIDLFCMYTCPNFYIYQNKY